MDAAHWASRVLGCRLLMVVERYEEPNQNDGRPALEVSCASRPLIVAGMHRSGTSLAASLLSLAGVDMGSVIPADSGNPLGYFEDEDFLRLHQRMLASATRDGEGGHRDWGWLESGAFDAGALLEYAGEAASLLEKRRMAPGPWGWKDPRVSLLLDFWDTLVPDARFLMLYRYPWDVADSMQRLGADIFLRNPDWAYRIWCFYNEKLLEFYKRHSQRCLLVSVNAWLKQPRWVTSELQSKLGLPVASRDLNEVRDRRMLATIEGSDPLIWLVGSIFPEAVRVLRELDEAADLSAKGLWKGYTPPNRLVPARDRTVDLTVIVPCFNDGLFLVEAVASVERLAPESCELIVVNDGSSEPHTTALLESLRKAGCRILDQEHSGLSAARNRAIAEARGRYILPLDADNRLVAGFIERAVEILDEFPEVGVVHGDWLEFGGRCSRRETADFDLERMLAGNYIDACAVFRKALWEDIGGYDQGLPAWEDWDFWLRAGTHGWQFRRLEEITFEYRVRPDSLVRLGDDPQVRESIVRRVWSKNLALQEGFGARLLLKSFRNEEELRGLSREIDRLSAVNSNLVQERAELSKRVEEVNQELRGSSREIDRLSAVNSDLAHERAELSNRVEELNQELRSLGRQLEREYGQRLESEGLREAMQREVADSTAELARVRRELDEKERLLQQLQAGLIWQLARRWWHLRNRLLGDETRRRRAWDRVATWLKGRL